jgi:glutamyl-tRNA synthetase
LEPWRRAVQPGPDDQWFDGHLARHPAQWDAAKLAWVSHYLKALGDDALLALVQTLARRSIAHETGRRAAAARLPCSRTAATPTPTLPAGWPCCSCPSKAAPRARPAPHRRRSSGVRHLADKLAAAAWDAPASPPRSKRWPCTAENGQLAPAVQVVVGRAQTPSLDAVLALFLARSFRSGCRPPKPL